MAIIAAILLPILSVLYFLVIAHFIMSWLIQFQVLNIRQEFVAQVWYMLQRILDPLYSRIRRFLPDLGGIDLSPIVLIIGIMIIRNLIAVNMGAF